MGEGRGVMGEDEVSGGWSWGGVGWDGEEGGGKGVGKGME